CRDAARCHDLGPCHNAEVDHDSRQAHGPDPTGRWVTTGDGRRLHAVLAGEGHDLVVLEAGLGAGALSWAPVMEQLSRHARVVAYDRAGYGPSDPDPRPRDLSRLADDLLDLIAAVEHRRLVLVGHSWGGPVVRLAAARLLRAAALPGAASTAVGGPAGRTARP